MNPPRSLFDDASHLESIALVDAELAFAEHFYPPAVADDLFATLLAQTHWRQESIQVWGKAHRQPRLTAWHGDDGSAYSYSGIHLQASSWTPTLLRIRRDISAATGHEFNSVLLNLYRDQQDSMGWHSDDEPELGRNPVIASLSLGAMRRFKLKHTTRKEQKTLALDLPGGSLLIMAGDTQHHWQHGIAKQTAPIGPRINLTFRQIIAAKP
ncbi:MAG: alpha-ketoglutarate-dependent dioxygenase AlkB [Undibacterium sp.]|uniref:alpha-ketoglutarate-dependent dioxygenase AlkB family protein n=1 Tax=Undibacterium sp. TaxID=1914977 RepID=UPI0027177F2D|nr:alpha-ketoglutarate-dependent dioxygenase AlkB [Undibacterium sp.]MDO8650930.1 alpha-ketoglutarate-dependent dioxygenase AlkB [Undibacterium sp.]